MPTHDVIIGGLGAMGSAAAFHLARRGVRVLGLERFDAPNVLGSSHGKSRIIREAYFEDPLYVPLVQRAYRLWEELERLGERPLFVRTGGLMVGPEDGVVVAGALASARQHALPYERLTAAEVYRRIPGFRPTTDMVGVWEPRAGYLVPEAAIATHLALAARHGAELRTHEPIVSWRAVDDGVEVTTPHGRYSAARLVLAAGAWMGALAGEPRLPLTVERTVIHWFRPPQPALYAPDRFPIFICEYTPGLAWYGIPDDGEGLKAALHHHGESVDPDTVRRTVGAEEVAYVRALLRTFMPAADGPLAASAVCLYSNTPDGHFILDRHPAHPQVLLASPCSGHGFKFSSALGELVAAMALDEAPPLDLAPFRLARFR